MDFSNSWIISLADQYVQKKGKRPLFISDWNSVLPEDKGLSSLIKTALTASSEPFNYIYAFDQKGFKNKLATEYLSPKVYKTNNTDLDNSGIAITLSPTASLHLSINLLFKKGIIRFLVITPTFHSILTTLKDLHASILFFHLSDENDFNIDLKKIEEIILEKNIGAIILCDPVYSCGVEVPPSVYTRLVEVCSPSNIWIIVDYALGGADWDPIHRAQYFSIKISCVLGYEKFIFIESTAKRLHINGLKTSIILTNKKFSGEIEEYSSRVYGGFSLPQITLLEQLYSRRNVEMVSKLIENNIEIIKANFETLRSFLFNTDFELYPTNSANLTMIVHKKYTIEDVNSKAIITNYLFDEDLLAFPTIQYFLYKQNRFGFRVNLLQDVSKFLLPLTNCLKKNIMNIK